MKPSFFFGSGDQSNKKKNMKKKTVILKPINFTKTQEKSNTISEGPSLQNVGIIIIISKKLRIRLKV